ncbi:hypothetical protein K7432_008359 [Basidiobolus ranarum]|uniref:Uncharacterized protein n=1 Tax=Basidiobolus ranarum TaxID=34480 RepID=A0ABR2WRX8_9FUNG
MKNKAMSVVTLRIKHSSLTPDKDRPLLPVVVGKGFDEELVVVVLEGAGDDTMELVGSVEDDDGSRTIGKPSFAQS